MERRIKDGVRAGATAVGVAAFFMGLASTAQTPDGFIHASFGGPLDVFAKTPSDVLAIGDGASDPSELATLLRAPTTTAAGTPRTPYRVAVEAGSTPGTTTINVYPTLDPTAGPTAAPAVKDAAILPSKPVVDSQGKVDCTGSVSCKTDPVTNVTTVTYPDGVVAIVQKINDLTVVAYKTLTDALPAELRSLLPPVPTQAPPVLAAQAPAVTIDPVTQVPTTAPMLPPPAPETAAPAIDPGPPAPETATLGPSSSPNVPKVNVSKPPVDFGSDQPDRVPAPSAPSSGLGKVKDTLGSVVKSVTDAVGKVVNPSAGRDTTTPGKDASRRKSPKSTPGTDATAGSTGVTGKTTKSRTGSRSAGGTARTSGTGTP